MRDRASVRLAHLTNLKMPKLLHSPRDELVGSLQLALQGFMEEKSFPNNLKLVGLSPLNASVILVLHVPSPAARANPPKNR